jgi:hypothetical protein
MQNNKINHTSPILFSLLFLVHFCSAGMTMQKNHQSANKKSFDQWITIFVHGSFSLKPHLTLTNMMNMLYDTLEESIYHRATEINRRDPFYHKNQAMLGFGLEKVHINAPNKDEAARILGYSFEQISQIAGNQPSNQYYTYGWSGLVSHSLRYAEAEHMYIDLLKLKNEYENKGFNPKFRIVSYSHGGNMALQLGAIFVTKPKSEQLFIDELFFLGTPIQVETDYLINSPAFKRVYNIYSIKDSIQRLDFFSFKRFFSNQRFKNRRNFEIPEKLTQYQIKISNYKPKKGIDPEIPLPQSKKQRKKLFKKETYCPGHFEVWFLGWTLLTFRENFPTNPLPVAVFLPLLTLDHDQHPELSHDLIVDINTTEETITFIDRTPRYKRNKPKLIKPFISKKKLQQLQKYALQFESVEYDLEMYNKKTINSIKIAKAEQRSLKNMRKKIIKKYDGKQLKNISKKEIIEQEKAASIHLYEDKPPFLGHLA